MESKLGLRFSLGTAPLNTISPWMLLLHILFKELQTNISQEWLFSKIENQLLW